MIETTRVPAPTLRGFCAEAFESLDVGADDAATVADVLVEADLLGFDSHGVARLHAHPGYVPGLQAGLVKARPEVRVVEETPATALLDADGGLGPVAAVRGVDLAVDKARAVGIGAVGVRDGRHFGIAGYYALRAAAQGMIGIASTNAGPWVVPTFGREKLLGTNPIAVAAPVTGADPLLSDFATSTISFGKVELAYRRKQALVPGWAVDGAGRPTTDPEVVAREGSLTPLGGTPEMGSYKGYALAVVVDLLTGILTGTGWSRELHDVQAGHFFMAIHIDAFGDAGAFGRALGGMLSTLQGSRPADGASEVLVPGQREFVTRRDREANGIPVPVKLVGRLDRLADELGIPPLSAAVERDSGA